jgi:hypothetical protein
MLPEPREKRAAVLVLVRVKLRLRPAEPAKVERLRNLK